MIQIKQTNNQTKTQAPQMNLKEENQQLACWWSGPSGED